MSIETNKSDKILKISLIITLILLAGILIFAGVTYAFWQKEYESEKENLLSSGCFSFKLTDKDSINLVNAYPISEDDAMKQTPYNFTIENNCSIDMYYNITLNTTGSSDLDSSIRYKLIDNEDNIIGTDIISNLSTYKEYNNYTYTDDGGEFNIINSYVLGSDSLKAAVMNDDNTQVVTAGESKTYNLYLWLDESVDASETMNKSFEAKVLITSKATTDTSKKILSSTVALGDYIKMTPSSISYEIDTTKTGYEGTNQELLNPSELDTWRVIKINVDGTIEMISEYTSSIDIHFSGRIGYQNYVGYLNEIAKQYENSKYTIKSRYVGYNNQTEYINDTSKITQTTPPWDSTTVDNSNEPQGGGDISATNDINLLSSLGILKTNDCVTKEAKTYWVASRVYYYFSQNKWYLGGRVVNSYGTNDTNGFYYYENGYKNGYNLISIRPIVVLKSNITEFTGEGTVEQPYTLN